MLKFKSNPYNMLKEMSYLKYRIQRNRIYQVHRGMPVNPVIKGVNVVKYFYYHYLSVIWLREKNTNIDRNKINCLKPISLSHLVHVVFDEKKNFMRYYVAHNYFNSTVIFQTFILWRLYLALNDLFTKLCGIVIFL